MNIKWQLLKNLNARQDKKFWELIVKKEIEFTKLEGMLDCDMNIIYVVEKYQ